LLVGQKWSALLMTSRQLFDCWK